MNKLKNKVKLEFRAKVTKYFDKNGMYMMLIIFLGIVSISAVFITSNELGSSISFINTGDVVDLNKTVNDDLTMANNSSFDDVLTQTSSFNKDIPNEQSSISTPAYTNENNLKKPVRATVQHPSNVNEKERESIKQSKVNFLRPLTGRTTLDYSDGKLIYSKTLNEWRMHLGVDIQGNRGTPVKSAADGIVSEIKNDPRLGNIVIIEHNNGYKSVYANLASGDMVSQGKIVKTGDVVGSIGNTANFEALDEPHLHFEIIKDRKQLNPKDYISLN